MKFCTFLAYFLILFFVSKNIAFPAETDLPNSQEDSRSIMGDLDLEKTPHEWLSVISGRALIEPVRTSYGWAAVTDGRMITAFSENGAVLWQKSIPSAPEKFISASKNDFLAVTLKNKKLALLNPSGVVLWTAETELQAATAPLFGRDGRIFVFASDSAACFGANGIRKWITKIPAMNRELPPVELNDGSVIIFAEALENRKTVGTRISPFGEMLERIVFADQIRGAFSVPDGALLSFADGTLGLCAFDKASHSVLSKWVIKNLALSAGTIFENLGSQVLVAAASPSPSGTKIHIVNTNAARTIRSFDIPEIKSANYVEYTSNGIFVADSASGALYSIAGKKIRAVRFPKTSGRDSFDFVLFGQNGVAVLVSKSWKITGWKIVRGGTADYAQKTQTGYETFYSEVPNDFSRMHDAPTISRKNAILSGDYASEEKKFWKDAQFVIEEYFTQRTSLSATSPRTSEETPAEFGLDEQMEVISMLGSFGTRDAANYLARVLALENDETVLRAALKSVQEFGYDPDFLVIGAIEQLIKKSNPMQEKLIAECCESLYSICRFMGRPALYKKGRAIISNLFLPQYSQSTKKSARKVYEKLAEINL